MEARSGRTASDHDNMWRRLLFVLGALLLAEPSLAVSRRDVVAIEKKKPTRSPEAVRKATRQAVTGYQGHSTTKGKPYASAKGELEPSHMSRQKWTDSQIERRGWQGDGLVLTVPFLVVRLCISVCLPVQGGGEEEVSVSAGCIGPREEKADAIAGGCAESNAAKHVRLPGRLHHEEEGLKRIDVSYLRLTAGRLASWLVVAGCSFDG